MSGDKEGRELGDKRISDAGDLFRRTEPAPTERPPIVEEPEEPKAIRKSRAWDRRPENRAYSYRLGQDLDDLIKRVVEAYKADGWRTTKSEVIRAWALAGYEKWLADELELPGRAIDGEQKTRGKPAGWK